MLYLLYFYLLEPDFQKFILNQNYLVGFYLNAGLKWAENSTFSFSMIMDVGNQEENHVALVLSYMGVKAWELQIKQ